MMACRLICEKQNLDQGQRPRSRFCLSHNNYGQNVVFDLILAPEEGDLHKHDQVILLDNGAVLRVQVNYLKE